MDLALNNLQYTMKANQTKTTKFSVKWPERVDTP